MESFEIVKKSNELLDEKASVKTVDDRVVYLKKQLESLTIAFNSVYKELSSKRSAEIGYIKYIKSLETNNKTLLKEVEDLKEELQKEKNKNLKDSTNSSKSPSSDSYKKSNKKKTSYTREKSGKKQGGQKNHEGTTLAKPEKIDKSVNIYPEKCKTCRLFEQCKKHNAEIRTTKSRYTVDIVLETKTTESTLVNMKCCQKNNQVLEAEFPVNLQSYIQYGDNLSAFIVLLNNLRLSCDRIEEIFDNAYNISLCQSTIINKINKCAKLIEPTLNEIKERLSKSKFVHCDESGVRVEGLTMWTHTASNDFYTYLTCSSKRGYDGIVENGVLVSMVGGCAIHDCWAPYWKFHKVEHAICL